MMAIPGLARGTLRRDLALAGAYLVGGLLLFSLASYRQFTLVPWPGQSPVFFLITLAAAVVAIGLRRVAPVAGVLLGTAALLADVALGGSLATLLAFTQVLFDGCVYGSPRLWRWLLRLTVAVTAVALLAGVVATGSWQGAQFAVLVVLIGVLPVVSGISVRQYRDQAEAERDRAEQTARLVELDRRRAVTAERTRMAGELHDVIANHLSAVAIHATAALSVRSLDRSQVDHALRVIRENSVQGLAEMRQMIELLRDAGAAADPPDGTDDTDRAGAVQARLSEVDRLAERARRAGLRVDLATRGTARPLPVSVDLAAYRIVQESLTNALKHGAGTADVTIAYQPDRIQVTVENPLPEAENDRPGRAAVARGTGAGAGLIGMRERTALLDGRFEAGSRQRRWRVHAELPTAGRTP